MRFAPDRTQRSSGKEDLRKMGVSDSMATLPLSPVLWQPVHCNERESCRKGSRGKRSYKSRNIRETLKKGLRSTRAAHCV